VWAIRHSGDGHREARQHHWGLIPFWAKDPKIGYKLINARSETVLEKPSFRDAFKSRRCLIPADGFYEWKRSGNDKRPFSFGMKDDSVFAFAGLWEHWKAPDGKVIESCTILTTTPNQLLKDIHDRMPVILPRQHYAAWLDSSLAQPDALLDLLVPFDARQMKRCEVSAIVNNATNENPECAQPLEGKAAGALG
jgi:putative SOS response-associated peptidase YedK